MATAQRKFVVYLPEEEALELEALAKEEDRTYTNLARQAIRKFLRERREARPRSNETGLSVKIIGDPGKRSHSLGVIDVATGEQVPEVESFTLNAHVSEGITCVLHRFAHSTTGVLIANPDEPMEDHVVARYDTEVRVMEVELHSPAATESE